jgi:membrane protein involved in colicin uptake
MKTFLLSTMLAGAFVLLSVAESGFVGNAEAIIGMPRTPLSVAGVARRSMYREAAVATTAVVATNAAAANAAAANAAAAQASAANAAAAAAAAQQAAAGLPVGTMVSSLPPGCASMVMGGVNYFHCGNVYYRAGFQGNSVVYIVSTP